MTGGGAERIEQTLDGLSRSGLPGFCFVFALLVAIAFSGFLPASLIGIVGGSIYGLAQGFCVAALATTTGAWVSFLIGRSVFRDGFERFFLRHSGIHRIGDELVKGGWQFVCLLRMSPAMPFALTSYALGLSKIGARDYMLGTIASLPALFGYVCMGWLARHSVGSASAAVGWPQWSMLITGIAATVLLAFFMKRAFVQSANSARTADN